MDGNFSYAMSRRLSSHSTKIRGLSTANFTNLFPGGKLQVKTSKLPLPEKSRDEEDLITQAYLGYYENQKKEIVESWLSSHLTNKSKFEVASIFFEQWKKDNLYCAQLLSALRRYTIVHHINHHKSRDNISEAIQLLCTNKQFLESENLNQFVEYYRSYETPEIRIAYLILCFEVGMEAKRNRFINRAVEIFELLHCCEMKKKVFSIDLEKLKNRTIKHPLAIFSSAIPTLELQFNLCVSQKGIGISKMKWFNFLQQKSIGFPKNLNMCEDYLTYILEIKNQNNIGLDLTTDIGLLKSTFYDRFVIFTDLLLRRNMTIRYLENISSFVGGKWSEELNGIETNKKITHRIGYRWIQNYTKKGNKISGITSSDDIKKLYHKKILGLFKKLDSDESVPPDYYYEQLNIMGDLNRNNPLQLAKGDVYSWLTLFSSYDSKNISPYLLSRIFKDEKNIGDIDNDIMNDVMVKMTDDDAGRLNRSNIYSDNAFINMLRTEKFQVPSQIKNRPKSKSMQNYFREKFEGSTINFLNGFIDRSTGQLQDLSFNIDIKLPNTSQEALNIIREDFLTEKQYHTFKIASYFMQSYQPIQLLLSSKGKTDKLAINKTLKMNRLTLIARGLNELIQIVKLKTTDWNKNEITPPLSKNHNLLILPQLSKELDLQMDNFDKLMYTMLFVLHRTEELADCVVKLHNKMYNIELAQPYRTRFVNLITKYCKLIKLELVHIATLYQHTEGFNNYNKKHKNNIEGLISELTEKVEKSHKKELFRKLLSEVESVKSSARNEGFLRRTEKIIQVIDWINTSEKHSPIDFDIVNCELLRKDFFSQIVDVESPICSRNLLTTKLLSARSFSDIDIQDSTNNLEK